MLKPLASETVRKARLYISTGLTVKNSATACCSSLRAPSTPPRSLTSLYSVAYSALVNSCGPAVRNCEPLSRVKGLTLASHPNSFASSGGTGRHSPGWSPTVKENSA